MADPKYVRLATRLSRGTQVDLRSGWSISGLDVVEFPPDDYPVAQAFVRRQLGRGVLEPASQAEFDEVLETYQEPAVDDRISSPIQAAVLASRTDAARRKLEASRGIGDASGLSYKDDLARRKSIAAAQAALDGSGAPDEGADGDGEGSDGNEASADDQGQSEEKTTARRRSNS